MTTTPRAEFAILLDESIAAADEAYRRGIAANLRGTGDRHAWDQFEITMARAALLAGIQGVATVTSQAIAGGALEAPTENEPVQPAHFIRGESHKWGTVQVDLPEPIARRVMAMGEGIPDDHIADPGREDEPHVTIQYGIDPDVTYEQIAGALSGQGPITIEFGTTSIFHQADPVPVVIDVTGDGLRSARQRISESIPAPGDTHPEYHPHATIAYVDPGVASEYISMGELEAERVTVAAVTYVNADGQRWVISLDGDDEIVFVGRSKSKFAARDLPFNISDTADDFVSGPFLAAIEQFRDRVPELAATVRRLQGDARALGRAIREAEEAGVLDDLRRKSVAIREALGRRFWISEVDDITTTIDLRDLVASFIEGTGDREALGLVDFIDEAQALGAENLTRARLEMVYRNNLNTAYNDGQVVALRAPDVQRVMPMVMLLEIRDRRTRGNPAGLYPDAGPHFQMHGYINTMAYFEDKGIVPPNGHQCRGSIRAVTLSEGRRLGIINDDNTIDTAALARYNGPRQKMIDSGVYPDRGFNLRRTPAA